MLVKEVAILGEKKMTGAKGRATYHPGLFPGCREELHSGFGLTGHILVNTHDGRGQEWRHASCNEKRSNSNSYYLCTINAANVFTLYARMTAAHGSDKKNQDKDPRQGTFTFNRKTGVDCHHILRLFSTDMIAATNRRLFCTPINKMVIKI